MHIAAVMMAGRAHDAAVMVARVLDCDSLPFCTCIASLLATNLVGAHCSARFYLFGSSVCAATLLGQPRHDDGGGLRAGHDHGLLVQRLNDFSRQVLVHARCELGEAVGERFLAGSSKRAWRRVALKQIGCRRMVKARSENALERWMDLGQQAANVVAGLRDQSGEVVIEAEEHGELLLGQSKQAQRIRHRGHRSSLRRRADQRCGAWPVRADRRRVRLQRGRRLREAR